MRNLFLLFCLLILFCTCAGEESDTINKYYTADDDSADDDDDTVDDDDSADDATLVNYALDFDGIDDYVVVPDALSLDVTTAMTIEMWIYVRSVIPSGWNNIIEHYQGTKEGSFGWRLRINTGDCFKFETHNEGESTFVVDIRKAPIRQWVHVACIFDNDALYLYVDGIKVTKKENAEMGQATSSLLIGMNHTNGSFFDGMINEVRLSSVARYDANFTPAEKLVTDSHTIGLWHFDEGTGTIAYDKSANGNHGTLHGPTWVEH